MVRKRAGAMVENIEHWRMAKLVIDRYGDAAGPICTVFANARLAACDTDGVGMWLGIASAVGELKRCRNPDEALN